MYEQYLAAFRNGVIGIDIETNSSEEITSNGTRATETVTVTFAVTTDSEAWMTVDNEGFVYPAFGGTGMRQHELDEYAEQTVDIWRAITGDETTTCRYKTRDDASVNEDSSENIIDA